MAKVGFDEMDSGAARKDETRQPIEQDIGYSEGGRYIYISYERIERWEIKAGRKTKIRARNRRKPSKSSR
jgi:hypothetical protein